MRAFSLDAARLVEATPDVCILALTGDLAFSGLPSQFELAHALVDELVRHLRDAWGGEGVLIRIAVIPGNHDCDYSVPSRARDELIAAIAKDPRVAEDPAAISVCTTPLEAFFNFRDQCASQNLEPGSDNLHWLYHFPGSNGDVWIRCLNTAWLSQRTDGVGNKVFPVSKLSDVGVDADLVVSLMHHPLNWFEPGNARDVRQRLQQTSDVVLTGHEHLFAARNQQDHQGDATLYVEGLALQESGRPSCGFNVLVVDTMDRRFRVVPFQWDGHAFVEQTGPFDSWTALGGHPLKGSANVGVRPEMVARLSDPGIELRHPERGALTLRDIFVFPDVREIEQDPAPKQPKIFSARRLFELTAKHPRVLVTGARESGKTCLAKHLFVEFVEAGFLPVLLDGRDARLKADALRDKRELARIFEEQYATKRGEFESLDRDQVVVLLDNYQALSIDRAPDILKSMSHIAARVVLFSHDFVQHVNDLVSLTAKRDGAPEVIHFQIMPFGHVRREDLIEKYIGLVAPSDREKAEVLRVEMRHLLNTALGKFYAPPVPVAIVAILQARAFQEDLDLQKSSTYGYYYELLVKRSLAVAAMPGELDVSLGYLTEMARRLFIEGKKEWDERWFIQFHQHYNTKMGLELRYSDAHAALIERGMFVGTPERYEFRFGYIYYYFIARALADDLTTEEGRTRVRDLTTRLSEDDAANTLLFLTHLSKDASIIDPMLEQAARVFREAREATLAVEEIVIPDLEDALRDAVLEDRPIHEARAAYLEQMDAAEQAALVATAASSGADALAKAERTADVATLETLVSRMYTAFRTMQILGQLLKNFPGTLDAEKKLRVARTTYGVGLRVLGTLQGLLQDRTDDTIRGLVELIRDQHPDMSDDKLMDRARNSLGYFHYVAAFGTTQRIAASVGSPLLQPIFERINADSPTPAIKLITVALDLDRADRFPEDRVLSLSKEMAKNPIAMRMLKGLVITHFHLFDEPMAVRQRICSVLKIDFKQLPPQVQQRAKLLKG